MEQLTKDRKMEVQLEPYIELIKNYALVALRKVKKSPTYSYKDLLQEGFIAFLYAKKFYSNEKGASFKTFLIMQLRHHLSDIVRASYRNKESNLYQEKLSEVVISPFGNPVEVVHTSCLLENFTPKELKYIETMLSLGREKRSIRRKVTRKTLCISQSEENVIKNSISNKVTIVRKNRRKISLLEITRRLIQEKNNKNKVILAIVTERIKRFGDNPAHAKKRAVQYYNYIWNQQKGRKIRE